MVGGFRFAVGNEHGEELYFRRGSFGVDIEVPLVGKLRGALGWRGDIQSVLGDFGRDQESVLLLEPQVVRAGEPDGKSCRAGLHRDYAVAVIHFHALERVKRSVKVCGCGGAEIIADYQHRLRS